MVGTSHYMAPEIEHGSVSGYDEKVDLYACGIIAFECW
jgi:serine/threonine protein kinase